MSLTLLLDMDDTLLVNDMDRFLPVYLQKLAAHLQDSVSPDRMIQSLMAGTRAMVHKQLPAKSLEVTFDEVFYPGIKGTKEQYSGKLHDFYTRVYPDLKSVTAPMPGAVKFVEWAFAQGYTIAIATNPLFPRSAIEQRLAWAGLPISKYPFALVTSFESLHFAKPNPAYYAEILGQLEWPEQPAVMVGNSLTDDILPARSTGLSAFHLLKDSSTDGAGTGTFEQLKEWLKTIEGKEFAIPSTAQALTALLASTPAALEILASRLDESGWNQRPRSNEWSLGEVFCHLRDVDIEVTLPRIERIVREYAPFITAEETDVWADERDYLHEDAALALDGFTRARTDLLLALQHIQPLDWSRPARHAIFGPTTLGELLTFTITHDQNHLRQVAKTIRWMKD